MAAEEKRAWIMLVVTVVAYGVYLVLILGRPGGTPLDEVPYVATMLWTIGGAIAAAILLDIVSGAASPKGGARKDQRDREITRFGDYVGQSIVVLGGLAALLMSMAELEYFWISNAIYLAFVLSSILGSVAKVVAYRRGFQEW
jgi:hypothetical protein